jgi:hypothetical protein
MAKDDNPNAGAPEIEITTGMAEAGEHALLSVLGDIGWWPTSAHDLAIEVYRAMAALDSLRRNPIPARNPKEPSRHRGSIETQLVV